RRPDLFPYVPGEARDLRPAPGLAGRVGRTVTAIGATLLDAVREGARLAEAGQRRVGGLRAGDLSAQRGRLRLSGYSLVDGIALTGTVPLTATGTGTLTVGGPAAAPGRLRLRAGRLSGELGGHRVRVALSLPRG